MTCANQTEHGSIQMVWVASGGSCIEVQHGRKPISQPWVPMGVEDLHLMAESSMIIDSPKLISSYDLPFALLHKCIACKWQVIE